MSNVKLQLLSPTELLDIYGIPALNDAERHECFTLNNHAIKIIRQLKNTADAVYFIICAVFLQRKHTLIDFGYQNTTEERRHIMSRYFPNKPFPKSFPTSRTIARLENKALKLCGYQRFTCKILNNLMPELQQLALSNPRQRQLCRAFLNLLTKYRIAIPGYSTIQSVVSDAWNTRNDQVITAYVRSTTKKQRAVIMSLLDKTDRHYRIISIKKDMKAFNTADLWQEIEKHAVIKPIFEIAKTVLPKLKLSAATIDYYATLINYYNGARLKDINQHTVGLYLLCYCYTRHHILNDNLLEALKKRTIEYETSASEYATQQSQKQLDLIKDTRKKVSGMLFTIKNHPNKEQMPKAELYKHVPEEELITTAELLVNDNFDKDWLFWKYIDSVDSSIKLNLKKIFLAIDLVATHDEALQSVVSYIKSGLIDGSFCEQPIPDYVKAWIRKNYYEHVMPGDKVIHNRLEFLLYKQIAYHISTNKLTMAYSVKYKKVADDLMPRSKWDKEKRRILKELDYPKLIQPMQEILTTKQAELDELYQVVNADIASGKNQHIIVTRKENGEVKQWRMRPLEAEAVPNDSLLAGSLQRSIAEIIQFVDNKTKFTRAFESILPKSKKGVQDNTLTMAAVLANAIRMGVRKMADVSDLNKAALLAADANYLRVETLVPAIDIINNATAKLPIYKEWCIDSILHGSLDGLKLETRLHNIFARSSSKYFGTGVGVSAYNKIVNFLPITGNLIGAHDYEGNFTFEMVHHQNTSEIKPTRISTDKHGTNVVNFGLFDFTDMIFAPRIPKPHREAFWGFGEAKNYEGLIVKPAKFVNEALIVSEEDNIHHLVASLLTYSKPSTVIRKLSSNNYHSKTKDAFAQYNSIVKSQFLLLYLHDHEFRRAILVALNRGEAYNGLYRAITLLKKGNLRGQSEAEMEVWHQCTRLISAIILYYNTYILNSLYVAATTEQEKELLLKMSPCAWSHINLLGYYQFCDLINEEAFEQWIKNWDWKQAADTAC